MIGVAGHSFPDLRLSMDGSGGAFQGKNVNRRLQRSASDMKTDTKAHFPGSRTLVLTLVCLRDLA